MSDFTYSVAIRTVGKAGDKYIQELRSLHAQTIKPTHIYVFLAHGFERPKEQVGMEEYVDTPKGLVHQRAAANMIQEDYLLIIDDDVYFPPDAIEQMYRMLKEKDADGVVADTFPTQSLPWSVKAVAYMSNDVRSRGNDGWAIKIQPSGAFSYNNHPQKAAALPTESGAGTALFVERETWRAIHYEDEEWVDQFPAGTFGEDQLMFYKFTVNGFHLLMWYNSGVVHLDANTNKASAKSYDKLYYRAMSLFLTWHRSLYSNPTISEEEKESLERAYRRRYLRGIFTRIVFSLLHGSFRFVKAYMNGNKDAKMFVKQVNYLNLPPYYIRNIEHGE